MVVEVAEVVTVVVEVSVAAAVVTVVDAEAAVVASVEAEAASAQAHPCQLSRSLTSHTCAKTP